MIIAIPMDENKIDICVSFARAPYFMIHNTDLSKTELIENPAADAEGGAGVKAAQFVLDNNADTLITVRCGENAAEVFNAADMKIYKSQGSNAMDNIKALQEGKISLLTHFHAGFSGNQ